VNVKKTSVDSYISFNPGSAVYTGSELDCAAATISGITPGANPWTYTYIPDSDGNASLGTTGKPVTAGTYAVTATYTDADNTGTAPGRTFTVTKAGQATPGAPSLSTPATSTSASIALQSVDSGAFEVAYSTATTPPTTGWYTYAGAEYSHEFTGLTPGTTYYFFARAGGDANHNVSPVSAALSVTTVSKANQTAPAAPTSSEKTAASVTLSGTTAAMQYAYNTTGTNPSSWSACTAASTVISGLAPNTTYYFYLRLAETETLNASPASAALSVTTDKAMLHGSVAIFGTHAYGQTLTAYVSELDTDPSGYPLGALSYYWFYQEEEDLYDLEDAEVIGTGSSYKIQASDIGKYIGLFVTAANADGVAFGYNEDEVEKAPADDLSVADKEIYIPVDETGSQTFDLRTLALAPAYGLETGAVTYSVDDYDNLYEGTVLNTSSVPAINADGYTLEYTLNNTATAGKTAYIDILIQTEYFEDVYATIYLEVTIKTPVDIAGISVTSRAYNGQPIAPTGTPTAAGVPRPLYITYFGTAADGEDYDDTTPPTKAGAYTLYVKTYDDDMAIGSLMIPFTIGKAPLTIKADNKSATVGGIGPALTYTVQGLASGDAQELVFEVPPTVSTSGNLATAGSYPIEVSGGTLKASNAGDKGYNYEIVGYTPGTLTVTAGGGGTTPPGGGTTTPTTPTTDTATAADGEVSVNYTQSGGTVTPELPAAKVDEIIEKSEGTASLDLSGVSGSQAATLPKTALDAFAGAGLDLELKLASGTVTISEETLDSIVSQATGEDVTISVNTVAPSSLTAAQQEAINDGDIVLDISISAGIQAIHNFDGTISVTVPYTGVLPVAVWYLNDAGELEKLVSTYDAATGTITFTVEHLSLYVLAQDTAWQNPFTDVKAGDWFYGDVEYAVVNGLFNGTGATTFDPNAPMTRAMLITVLARLDGQDTEGGETWYTKAVAWGVENGITDGTRLDENVTRREIATLLYRYAGIGADGWDGEALEWVQEQKIMNDGRGDDTATRAEVAAMLHRFIENVK
jgi:hypothetical protein